METTTFPLTSVELLAPAGDWECLRAAWENGADAVYFGCDCGFNARARATNFPLSDLPRIADELHRRGVRGYVTLNTLVFSRELPEVEDVVRAIAAAGLDAVLVQDLGLARLIRRTAPGLPIHASTQMTLTSAECIAAVEALGLERVVLPRELSLDEIRQITAATSLPVEVFVHGALCVAYSGQCLTSESFGGRSANRGQCAQACRLPYDLICDGVDVDLQDRKYLLSPQDLAAYPLVPDLLAAGVASLKIEGRLKTPEYVANIVRHYRQAIDAALASQAVSWQPRDVYEMEMSFSRGFSPGWLEGCEHKRLVPALSSAKRGVLLGEIRRLTRSGVELELQAPIARGDGVVFAGDRASGNEIGGRVYQVFQAGKDCAEEIAAGVVELRFHRTAVPLQQLFVGQAVWKTDDPRLNARLRATFSGPAQRRVPLDLVVYAEVGAPLRVRGRTAAGQSVECDSDEPLAAAEKRPINRETLRGQFGRLGNTIYQLRNVEVHQRGEPMVPLSVLGTMRRRLVEQLTAAGPPVSRNVSASLQLESMRRDWPPVPAREPLGLVPLVRNLEQLRAVCAAGSPLAYADFADIREYRSAIALGQEYCTRVYIATPRIQKPGEIGIFRAMARYSPAGILVRNLAGLDFFRQQQLPVVADFSFNVANELTGQFIWSLGVARLTPSYDLNREQLLDLLKAVPPGCWEVVIHQHMPMFHMEHCVFCSVLSPGTNKTNCGRPCDRHRVQLRDRIGVAHPLTADVGCRNTLYNATPQSSAEIVRELQRVGIGVYRVEFLEESPQDVQRTLGLYRRLLAGEIAGREVWTQLQAMNRVGVTRGTLESRRDPLAII